MIVRPARADDVDVVAARESELFGTDAWSSHAVVVAEDGGTIEGSWGHRRPALERNGAGKNGSSGQCGILDKDVSNACGNGP